MQADPGSLFSLLPAWYRLNNCLKAPLSPKQPTNLIVTRAHFWRHGLCWNGKSRISILGYVPSAIQIIPTNYKLLLNLPFLSPHTHTQPVLSIMDTVMILTNCVSAKADLWFHWSNIIKYRISSVIRWIIFLPKQSQRSRSVLKDGSRSLALFRKGKIGIITKFHRTDLVIWSHSRGTKTLSYSRINTVHVAPQCSVTYTYYWQFYIFSKKLNWK